jgi:hypothetical protein
MKVTVSLLFYLIFLSPLVYGNYDSWKRNPDGTYVVGACYDSWQRNPDGTYVLGGMYDSWQRNPDGTYVVSGNFGTCRK